MRRVALLPQKLTCAQEWRRMLELPTHHRAPLVKQQGKIAVRVDPIGESRVHDGFRCGADGNGLVKIAISRFRHPRHFRCEALHMLLLCLQLGLRDKHREVAILHAKRLDARVKKLRDSLPQAESPRPKDIATGDVVKLDHLRLRDHLLIPLWEVAGFGVLEALGVRALLLPEVGGWRACLLDGLRRSGALGRRRRRRCFPKVDDHRRVLGMLDEGGQLGRCEPDRSVVAQRVHSDLVRGHQRRIEHQLDLSSRVVHDGERRGGALGAAELLLERRLVGEAEVGTRRANEIANLFHVELAVGRDRQQKEPGFFVLDK
mmetsp:Transcript_46216/g.92241  ORF Transcript_46216/g.92241 Transcript_46216/m.92241 type:complete len:317 (+) Transcript_46216:1629-2579(+)